MNKKEMFEEIKRNIDNLLYMMDYQQYETKFEYLRGEAIGSLTLALRLKIIDFDTYLTYYNSLNCAIEEKYARMIRGENAEYF